eukprot:TRINITY_DN4666_c0_g1_i2.p2 TRINITY_DN4666_c0_g1~~TRINITY_DN4666_c0_g1_i2.p2  ORF type:complete len:127 (-),score=15.95 TRINITY_DN4666_c0_g1_i2:235-615(-)
MDGQGYPIAPKVTNLELSGLNFTIFQCNFSDCVLIMITETGAVGCIMEASVDEDEVSKQVDYEIRTVLGQRNEDLQQLLARRLMEMKVSDGCRKRLRLGVGIKDLEINLIKQLVEQFKQNAIWNSV